VQPWCFWSAWRDAVSEPLRKGDVPGALNEAHQIVQPILLRRTKQTKDNTTGQPIVSLPPKHVHIIELDLAPAERAIYNALYRTVIARFNNLLASDKVLKHYMVVLQMLLLLRQATCHPFLAFARLRPRDPSLEEFAQRLFGGVALPDTGNNDTASRDSELVTRLLGSKEEVVFCAACGEIAEASAHAGPCGHIICCSCLSLKAADNLCNDCPACCKPPSADVRDADGVLPEELQSSKIRTLVRALRSDMASGRRVVVFSQWTSFLRLVGRALDATTPAVAWRQFDGSLSLSQRQQTIQWLQQGGAEPSGRTLLISLMAGGVGLNLTSASRVYLLDLWWNPALEEQAIQRIHRIGQTQEVHVYKFVVRESIERGIVALQRAKSLLSAALLDRRAALRGHYSQLGVDDFKLLFSHGEADLAEQSP